MYVLREEGRASGVLTNGDTGEYSTSPRCGIYKEKQPKKCLACNVYIPADSIFPLNVDSRKRATLKCVG